MSFWELIVVFLVALIVVKPDRLPEIAYYLGRTLARLRRWYQNFQEKYNLFL